MRLNPFSIALSSAICVLAAPVFAFDPFVVKDIRVEGLQRTEPGTVFNYLPVKVGDTISDDKVRDAISALFATGFFQDVRLEADGGKLIVSVVERPTVGRLIINGTKEFPKDQLLKAMKDNGLAESRIFDQSILDQAVQELKRQYYSKGKYSVVVKPTIDKQERNRVAITLGVVEGESAQIQQINLVGNKSFPDAELKEMFSLTTPGMWTWFTKNDQYSKPKMTADTEVLRSFYQNRGFLEFNIDSQQVALSADKQDVFLTINMTEGQKYTIRDIRLAGELLVPEAELRKLIDIQTGDVFNREKINEAISKISERLGDEGFAFANVNAVPEIDKNKAQASFTFYIDPGRKTFVRRININGNTKTRDEVIRRELRQMEGATYNGSKIRRSKERVDLLGYFSEVNVETPVVAENSDQVDLNVNVTEKPTGNLSVGLGYSQDQGMVFNGSITQSNIFGSGKYLSASVNSSTSNQVYSLSFRDPYSTADGISRGYDVYKRRVSPESTVVGQYRTDTLGAAIRFGLPLTEYDGIDFSVGAEDTEITLYDSSPTQYVDFVSKFGHRNLTLLGTVSWVRDNRDSAFYPTRGALRRVSAELAMPGGDIRYIKTTAQQQYFYPFNKYLTGLINIEGGYASGYGGRELPFYSNFYAGGVSSVRGFRTSSLGPLVDGDPVGGNKRLVTNAEVLFPFPGMTRERTVRMSAFVDGGSVWSKEQNVSLSDLRYSYGLAFTWISPVGPMKFAYSLPINDKPDDKLERFQFLLGTVF